jgi:hypothetical protein
LVRESYDNVARQVERLAVRAGKLVHLGWFAVSVRQQKLWLVAFKAKKQGIKPRPHFASSLLGEFWPVWVNRGKKLIQNRPKGHRSRSCSATGVA